MMMGTSMVCVECGVWNVCIHISINAYEYVYVSYKKHMKYQRTPSMSYHNDHHVVYVIS